MFWAGVGGIDQVAPARDNNEPASTVEQEGRARGRIASGGKVRFGDRPALQLAPLHRGLGYEYRRVFLPYPDEAFVPTHPTHGICSNTNNSS